MNKQFLNREECRDIIECNHVPNSDVVALFNIGYMVSNSIILAGQMIADAIRSAKVNDSPITRNKM